MSARLRQRLAWLLQSTAGCAAAHHEACLGLLAARSTYRAVPASPTAAASHAGVTQLLLHCSAGNTAHLRSSMSLSCCRASPTRHHPHVSKTRPRQRHALWTRAPHARASALPLGGGVRLVGVLKDMHLLGLGGLPGAAPLQVARVTTAAQRLDGSQMDPATQVRLVREDGSHEVMAHSRAAKEAARLGADLLLVAANAKPPVLRIGHLDKAAALARERERETRRKDLEQRRKNALKEVRIGPNTAEHDLGLKLKTAREFLEKGYKVKLTVLHKRWQKEMGHAKLEAVAARAASFAQVQQPQEGEKMTQNTHAVYLSPTAASAPGKPD